MAKYSVEPEQEDTTFRGVAYRGNAFRRYSDGAIIATLYTRDGFRWYTTCNKCGGEGRLSSYAHVENGRCWGCTQVRGLRLVAIRSRDAMVRAQYGGTPYLVDYLDSLR